MKAEHERIAQYVAVEILRKSIGHRMDPDTWLFTGERIGCLMVGHSHPKMPPGQYFPARANGRAVICYNRALPSDIRCHVLVHEMAHHVMMNETMESLFGHVTTYGYYGAEGIRDQIARRVEAIVFPGYRKSSRVRLFHQR